MLEISQSRELKPEMDDQHVEIRGIVKIYY